MTTPTFWRNGNGWLIDRKWRAGAPTAAVSTLPFRFHIRHRPLQCRFRACQPGGLLVEIAQLGRGFAYSGVLLSSSKGAVSPAPGVANVRRAAPGSRSKVGGTRDGPGVELYDGISAEERHTPSTLRQQCIQSGRAVDP
jgi:hypothetical protein